MSTEDKDNLCIGAKILFVEFGICSIERIVRVSPQYVWTELFQLSDIDGQATFSIDSTENKLLRLSKHNIIPVSGKIQVSSSHLHSTIVGVYRRYK